MQVVLLRVGIDTGSGGIHGPLFSDGSFEYIPIPDSFRGKGVDKRTYGNTRGRIVYSVCPRIVLVGSGSSEFETNCLVCIISSHPDFGRVSDNRTVYS